MAEGSRTSRIVHCLVQHRGAMLILGLLAAALAYIPAGNLAFDRSLENMFAPDDPVLAPYLLSKQIFGGEEIALAAYVDPELLTPEGMRRLDLLAEKIRQVPGVRTVLTLKSGPLGEGIIDTSSAMNQAFLELFEGYTVSNDRQTAGLVCMLAPETQVNFPRDDTVRLLREAVSEYPGGVLTGEPVMVVDGFRYLERDSRVLGGTATLLLVLTIILCFRSLRWVIVPIAIVNVTLLLTKAILVTANFQLSMVSSMLWAIITVIGIGMVMHIIVHFRESRAAGATPRKALYLAGSALAVPILWTCLTDAAGFGSLLWAKVGPVHDFGVMMIIGSLVAVVSAALLLPGLALIGGRYDPDPKRAWGEQRLDSGLHQLVYSIERYPKTLLALTTVVAVTSIAGCFWLEVETDFTKNFRASSPVVKSYQFVEANLGGAGVWDVLVPIDGEVDEETLERMRHLQTRLREEVVVVDADGEPRAGLTKVMSVVDALDASGLDQLAPGVPITTKIDMMSTQIPAFIESLRGEDASGRNYLRIMLRALERQPSQQKQQIIAETARISQEEFPDAQVTGFFVLLTQLIDSMIRDQWVTFSIAVGLIGLMMLLAFRSVPIALIALVPNALPILILTGLMGWSGFRINMGAAMIAAVSMGLSVDCSIHYLTQYRRVRKAGHSVSETLDIVHQSAGRAMIFATFSLIVGFSALTLSQFVPLIYFGVLVSLAALGGMLGNLVILPLLLRMVDRDEQPAQSPRIPSDTASTAPS